MINIGIGISWAKAIYSVANNVIANFKARVLSYPNSIFEAGPCLDATLEGLNAIGLLDNASLIITPNAYNTGILYDVIPNTTLGDMDVVRATTATRVNASGLIESVANNVPRLDYLNASCPSVLVEPQRTNVQISSEDFSNAIYLQIGVTVTTNTNVSPDGNTTADRLAEDTSTGFHTIDILNPPVVAGSYTVSVFVKANGRTKFQILGFYALTGNVDFDLTLGTATTTAPALNGKIENYGNGWYRCQATFTDLTGVGAQILFNILNNAGSNIYTGDGTSGLILWGAQLEAGTYSTSYIKTIASSVTRNADVISKTGITDLIGQTEGTIFIDTYIDDFTKQINEPVLLYVKGTSSAFIEIIPTGLIVGAYNNGSTFTGLITAGVTPQNGRHKIAFAYKNNDFILYYDGIQLGVDTSGLVSGNLTSFGLQYDVSQYIPKQNVNSAQLYKTRLTNTELAQLTTL
jgi:hypothetical protein